GLSAGGESFGNVVFRNNAALTGLTGLEGLTSVYTLFFENNPLLETLTPLDNLETIAGSAYFQDNGALSTCDIRALIERCAPPESTVSGNEPCN
ncbi:MAG TPA: hypothetical protein VFV94_12950, partial [Polyangiaceae bacterium]|nr:hypothetical protein [Polyangiaceae bacterium]